jgi:hypothetical protein
MESATRRISGAVHVTWGNVEGDEIPTGNTVGGPATKTPVSVSAVIEGQSIGIGAGETDADGFFPFHQDRVVDGTGTLYVKVMRGVRFYVYTCMPQLPIGYGDQDFGQIECNLRK